MAWTRLAMAAALVWTTPLTSSGANGAPRLDASESRALEIHPVEIKGYTGAALRISIDMPCGASFYGLIAQEDRAGQTLRLAAAIQRGQILCTKMAEAQALVVDYLATDAFATVTPLAVGLRHNRLVLGRLSDVRRTDAPGEPIAAIYETRCALPVGVLVRRAGARRLDVAMAERLEPRRPNAACNSAPAVRRLRALSADGRWEVRGLSERAASISRAFTLAIVPGHAVRREAGGLTVTFQRACHDAPVGIVLGRRTAARAPGRPTVAVGVLVAQFPNAGCAATDGGLVAGSSERQTINDPALTLGPSDRPVPLLISAAGVELRTPTKLLRVQRARPALLVSFLAACAGEPYTVFARDAHGRPAIGVLTAEATPLAKKCKSAPTEVSLAQPYAALGMSAAAPYPLKLKGLAR